MIADQKKFFEQEGLSVEITNFASGATAVDAFRAGRGDIVGCGDLPSLRLWQQKASEFARKPTTATSAWSLRRKP